MTQEEIIRMAREAGLPVDDSLGFPLAYLNESTIFAFNLWIERFANLAFAAGATHERAKELTDANISLYKLAEEAGFDVAQWAINGGIEVVIYEEGPITGELTRFAALVAAHEREKAKAVFEELEREVKTELINAINGAVELEREACAKVCDELGRESGSDHEAGGMFGVRRSHPSKG